MSLIGTYTFQPMPEILPVTINSLQEFIELIDSFHSNPENPIWYRGIGNENVHKLLPSLYRHKGFSTFPEFFALERTILNRFKERSVPFLDNKVSDDWENLFLMQHFGVPTRLLDWSENPFVGLFFALTTQQREKDPKPDAAIWALLPDAWNQWAFKHVTYRGGPLSVFNKLVAVYSPNPENSDMPPANQAAILGIHNSPRIVAQRGVFTISGSNIESIEDTFAAIRSEDIREETLRKITIPASRVEDLLNRLTAIGYSESVIFPDLEGLAREIKRTYKF